VKQMSFKSGVTGVLSVEHVYSLAYKYFYSQKPAVFCLTFSHDLIYQLIFFILQTVKSSSTN